MNATRGWAVLGMALALFAPPGVASGEKCERAATFVLDAVNDWRAMKSDFGLTKASDPDIWAMLTDATEGDLGPRFRKQCNFDYQQHVGLYDCLAGDHSGMGTQNCIRIARLATGWRYTGTAPPPKPGGLAFKNGLWTWTDATGKKHYSQSKPTGVE